MRNRVVEFLLISVLGATVFAFSFVVSGAAVWWLRVFGAILIAVGVATLIIKRDAGENEKPEPINKEYAYAVKDAFMTAPERELYERLLKTVGGDFAVFPQVALVSLVDKTTFNSFRNELFRIVDFALCDRKTLKPRLIIELNDASHKRADRIERDEKVKCISDRAGLGLLTVNTDELLDDKTLRKRVFAMLR